MKILADANPLYSGPLTGIGYFTQDLLDSLEKKEGIFLEGFAFNLRGKKSIKVSYPIQEQKIIPGKILSYPRHIGLDMPLSLFFNTRGSDIILGTNYLVPPTGNIPFVSTIHDLCFIDHPEWVQSRNAKILKTMLPKTLKRSSGVITISEFSANRIRDVYRYEKPILVISIPPKKFSADEMIPQGLDTRLSNKFYLFMSTIEPRKNIVTLLDAFEALPMSIQKNHPLVIAGKPGWDAESLNRLRSKKNKNVIYLDYVSENERSWLYRKSLVTIVPSLYEGFGMMTLESLSEEAPVITSDIPPQKEILGKSGLYFEPTDFNVLASHMLNITDNKYRDRVLDEQKKVLNNFSWDTNSNRVIEFLEGFVAK